MKRKKQKKTLKSPQKNAFYVILFTLVEQKKQNKKTPCRASHQLRVKKTITILTKSPCPKSKTHQIETQRNIDKPTNKKRWHFSTIPIEREQLKKNSEEPTT